MTKRKLFTKSFWLDTIERAARTGAQAVLLFLMGGGIVKPFSIEDAEVINAFLWDWRVLAGSFIGGAILAVLFAMAKPPKRG